MGHCPDAGGAGADKHAAAWDTYCPGLIFHRPVSVYRLVLVHFHYTLWKCLHAVHIIRRAHSLRSTNLPGKGNSDDSIVQAVPLKDSDDKLPVLKSDPLYRVPIALLLGSQPGGLPFPSPWWGCSLLSLGQSPYPVVQSGPENVTPVELST